MKWLVRLNLKEFWRGLTFRYGIVYLLLWLGGRTRTKPPPGFNWSVFTGVNESATEIVFFNSNFSKPFQQVQPIFKSFKLSEKDSHLKKIVWIGKAESNVHKGQFILNCMNTFFRLFKIQMISPFNAMLYNRFVDDDWDIIQKLMFRRFPHIKVLR